MGLCAQPTIRGGHSQVVLIMYNSLVNYNKSSSSNILKPSKILSVKWSSLRIDSSLSLCHYKKMGVKSTKDSH